MGYTIEISFSILKHPNVSEFKRQISSLALDYGCDHYYYMFEMEGETKIPRHHCIISIHFLDDEIFNCAAFIKEAKRVKDIHIECIYDDEIMCKLIYASRYYLQNIDKGNVIIYNEFKRERKFSENENIILNGLH